ncbi:MAG: hypothetical protein Q7J58_05930 [Hydrogenophaga sp.]|nr:hypothetical protein [Hydrogenophaga sp.]
MQVNFWIAPTDVNLVPMENARRLVEEYFHNPEDLPDFGCETMRVHVFPRLTYIDGYDGYFPMMTIGCPNCLAAIPTTETWAQELHEHLVDEEELDLDAYRVITPCCSTDVSALQLDFKGYGGFTRFAVELVDVSYEGSDKELLDKAKKILGCDLRKIEIWYT